MPKHLPPEDRQRKQSKPLHSDGFQWYRRFPLKALAGMRGLNPEQRGVYCTLIELCYVERGPIADDDISNARACECDVRRFRRIKLELLELERIEADPEAGTIFDARAVRELVNAEMLREKQSRRGRAGNRKRWNKPAGDVVELAVVRGGLDESANADDRPELTLTKGHKSESIPNEIKGPAIAIREEKRVSNCGGQKPERPAARAALPPSGGGARGRRIEGPNVAPMSEADRAAKLADMKAALMAAYPEEFEQESGADVGIDPPADRRCRRGAKP